MKKTRRQLLKTLDIPLIALFLIISLSTLLLLPREGDTVTIIDHGVVIYSGSLNSDVVITTESGANTICVQGGEVFMQTAGCPDKTCVAMGYANPSRPIVCIPNQVIVIIESNTQNGFDGVTY